MKCVGIITKEEVVAEECIALRCNDPRKKQRRGREIERYHS